MHPILKIFVKLLAIIFILIVVVQINNFYCVNFNKCRPFYLSFYYNKFKARKYQNVKMITNYSIINLNKNVAVTIDFDKTTSKIGEIAKVNLILKNLTNYEISVQNIFSFNEKIFEKFITILQCPCYRNISLKPKESKMISIEFFYHILVNESTLDELSKTLSQNNSLIIENKNSGEASIINNTQLTIKK
jgi:cytochrome c oxidase assembly protein Cox11